MYTKRWLQTFNTVHSTIRNMELCRKFGLMFLTVTSEWQQVAEHNEMSRSSVYWCASQ